MEPATGVVSVHYKGQCGDCGAMAVFDTTFPVLKADGARAVSP